MSGFFYIDQEPVQLTAMAVATSNAAATSQVFANMAIGTANTGRYVLVPVSWQGASTGVVLQDIVIAGITATLIVTGGFDAAARNTRMYMAQIPGGTTASITATFNVPPASCNLATLAVSGLIAASANATAASTAAAPTGTLSCAQFGAMVGCAYAGAGSPPSASWGGITEDFDANNGNQDFTVAHTNFSTIQTNLALTCTFSTTTGSSGCFVSFSPP